MILLIDNHDSFTFNLYQYFGEQGEKIVVQRSDRISLENIRKLNPAAIVLSSGPGRPDPEGIYVDVVREFYQTVPILGISFSHLAIAYAFGAEIKEADQVMHGKISPLAHTGRELFEGLKSPINVVRYHSFVIDKHSLPDCFEVTGTSMDDGEVMAIRHRQHSLFGLQFHPESIETEDGKFILENFTKLIRGGVTK